MDNKLIKKEVSLEFKLFTFYFIKNILKLTLKLFITFLISLFIVVSISHFFDFEMSYDSKLDFYCYILVFLIMFLVFFCDIWSKVYTKQLVENNPVLRMKSLDKKGIFEKYIKKAEKYQNSINLNKEQNICLENDTIKDKYSEIYNQVHIRLVSICNYISHFDYITEKSFNKEVETVINTKFDEIEELIRYMNKLDNLLVKIDSNFKEDDLNNIKDYIDALEDLSV